MTQSVFSRLAAERAISTSAASSSAGAGSSAAHLEAPPLRPAAVEMQGAEAAPTVPPAATPAPEPERMVGVAVVVGHQNGQAARIINGVVGSAKDGQFTIDPQYAQISYLFSLASSGATQAGARIVEINMLADDVAAFRANMIRGSGITWDRLYEAAASSMTGASGRDLMASMLDAEKANVRAGVDRFMASQVLCSFDVPVVYDVEVPQPDKPHDVTNPAVRATEADLINEGRAVIESLRINGLEAAIATAESAAVHPPAALPEQLRRHIGGFNLSVQGAVRVLARDEDQALRVLANVLDIRVHNRTICQNVLTYGPSTIQNADALPYVDADCDSGYDRYRD